jgi:hypothetical protein
MLEEKVDDDPNFVGRESREKRTEVGRVDSLEEFLGPKVRSGLEEATEDSSGDDGLGHPLPPSLERLNRVGSVPQSSRVVLKRAHQVPQNLPGFYPGKRFLREFRTRDPQPAETASEGDSTPLKIKAEPEANAVDGKGPVFLPPTLDTPMTSL